MPAHPRSARRTLLLVAKFALAFAILAYLVYQVYRNDGFTRLWEQQKDWPILAAGLFCTLVAISLNFCRWHLLIRAVGIDIRLRDTLRFGALGYALNFVSPGAIGGDFFKAIFLAHGQRGKRTEAVATVVADRLLGVTTMLAVAVAGIMATGMRQKAEPGLKVLCDTMLLAFLIALAAALLLLFVPALTGPKITALAQRIPLLGNTAARLLGTARAFRDQKPRLLVATLISLISNTLFITSVYLVARGLPLEHPTWADHLILVPIANIVAAIPITPAGLGAKEFAIDKLYTMMPGTVGVVEGNGTLVTLGHRVTEIAVACLGMIYIMSHRAEVREVYEEAEEMLEHEGETGNSPAN